MGVLIKQIKLKRRPKGRLYHGRTGEAWTEGMHGEREKRQAIDSPQWKGQVRTELQQSPLEPLLLA